MKFANRYELSDLLTSGAVETFAAIDITSGERVVVHIFETPQQPSNLPTIQLLLEAFRDLAPAPAELVINAGRYAGTAFAYLVTKMPEETALKIWIRSYETSLSKAGEISIPSNPTARDMQGPEQISTAPRSRTPQESGEPTGAFPAVKLGASEISAPISTSEFPAPSQSSELPFSTGPQRIGGPQPSKTGSFTSQFLSKCTDEAESSNRAKPRESLTSASHSQSFSAVFGSPLAAGEKVNSPARTVDEKGGEFTRFFQGPFSGEPSPDTPRQASHVPTPETEPGEFTKIFGPGEKPPGTPVNSRWLDDSESQSLSLTQILAQPSKVSNSSSEFKHSATLIPEKAIESGSARAIKTEAWDLPATPQTSSPPPISPDPALTGTFNAGKRPMVGSPLTVDLERKNATHLFSAPGSVQRSTLSTGPSEYTMIISGGKPAGIPEPPIHESVASSGGAGSPFAVPAVPVPPPIPAAPRFPPAPQFSSPVAVGLPATKPPQASGTPKPPVSYWPLILTMTVLFFLAVIMVMYFWLRH
jgi:hypothetical protein